MDESLEIRILFPLISPMYESIAQRRVYLCVDTVASLLSLVRCRALSHVLMLVGSGGWDCQMASRIGEKAVTVK